MPVSSLRACLLVVLVGCASRCVAADSTTADTGVYRHRGFSFDFVVEPHLSSPSSFATVNIAAGVGFGYVVSPRLSLGVDVFSGSENIPRGEHTPVWGFIPVGGASFQARYYLTKEERLRPFVLIAYDLFSLVDDQTHGYNGGGPRAAVGVEFGLSHSFAVDLAATYSAVRYHDTVNNSDPGGVFRTFTDHMLSIGGSILFYSDLLP